jgi:hypothetical protein
VDSSEPRLKNRDEMKTQQAPNSLRSGRDLRAGHGGSMRQIFRNRKTLRSRFEGRLPLVDGHAARFTN